MSIALRSEAICGDPLGQRLGVHARAWSAGTGCRRLIRRRRGRAVEAPLLDLARPRRRARDSGSAGPAATRARTSVEETSMRGMSKNSIVPRAPRAGPSQAAQHGLALDALPRGHRHPGQRQHRAPARASRAAPTAWSAPRISISSSSGASRRAAARRVSDGVRRPLAVDLEPRHLEPVVARARPARTARAAPRRPGPARARGAAPRPPARAGRGRGPAATMRLLRAAPDDPCGAG